MGRWPLIGLAICMIWVGPATTANGSSGDDDCNPWVSKIVSLQGSVEVKRNKVAKWQSAALDITLCAGDRLHVGRHSRAAIVLVNDSVIRLDQGTTMIFKEPDTQQTFFIQLLKGAAHFFSRKARRLKVLTPFVNGVVDGTEFIVRVDEEKTTIGMLEGRLLAENSIGRLILTKGQNAVAYADQSPHLEKMVRPTDAVHWSLYYPPILDLDDQIMSPHGVGSWVAKASQSIEALQQNDLMKAFAVIDGLGDDIDDARFFIYRAGLMLLVGRTKAAAVDLERALALDDGNSDAMALRSIISVVQNRKDDALDDALKAVAIDDSSSAAHIALSYAYQARFDVEAALNAALAATRRVPGHAIAWARLAELRLSLGDLNGALTAAKRAVELDAGIARTQTVLGFAYLTEIFVQKAEEAFMRAIHIDSTAPLPRLGLGLAKIRRGDLSGGRSEIEIAAGLDPGNAILRSYLGKAYFDEKRPPLDERQLEIAKALDPRDPTPWLYDAIRKQTNNQPIEALQDLQTSIRLNNNRAVYRSHLLLDEDLAARSAGLGRIYNELGFGELGLRQGWRSLDIDPANDSAHRLLADTYASRPRHQIARVSELLQAQLLQPLNMASVQPMLAETDLSILDQAGPGNISFNEFNPLFVRNRVRLLANGIYGSNDTWGDEIILSGISDRAAFSLGQFHYETDGFRDNNDLDQDLYNAFAQFRIGQLTAVQAEYRRSEVNKGDLVLRFDPDNFSSSQRETAEEDRFRLGIRLGQSTKSTLLGSFIFQKRDSRLSKSLTGLPGSSLIIDKEPSSYLAEIRHIYRSGRLNLSTGFGLFDETGDETTETDFGSPFFVNPPKNQEKRNLTHGNAYGYLKINTVTNIDLTLGASADAYDSNMGEERQQLNPKIGARWQVSPDTQIRAAVFRSLKRTLNANSTLEPTQLSGFNQFFDDANGTDVWRYGAAVDHAFSKRVYVGAEVSQRDLDVIQFNSSNNVVETHEWDEISAMAYAYWMPTTYLSLTVQYQYEKFDRLRENPGIEQILELETHRLPLGLGFYLPWGLSVKMMATYIIQDGEFFNPAIPTQIDTGDDQFWVVDVALRYQLPKRYGIISVGAKNLFDETFKYLDTDPSHPIVQPDQFLYAKVTLSF